MNCAFKSSIEDPCLQPPTTLLLRGIFDSLLTFLPAPHFSPCSCQPFDFPSHAAWLRRSLCAVCGHTRSHLKSSYFYRFRIRPGVVFAPHRDADVHGKRNLINAPQGRSVPRLLQSSKKELTTITHPPITVSKGRQFDPNSFRKSCPQSLTTSLHSIRQEHRQNRSIRARRRVHCRKQWLGTSHCCPARPPRSSSLRASSDAARPQRREVLAESFEGLRRTCPCSHLWIDSTCMLEHVLCGFSMNTPRPAMSSHPVKTCYRCRQGAFAHLQPLRMTVRDDFERTFNARYGLVH